MDDGNEVTGNEAPAAATPDQAAQTGSDQSNDDGDEGEEGGDINEMFDLADDGDEAEFGTGSPVQQADGSETPGGAEAAAGKVDGQPAQTPDPAAAAAQPAQAPEAGDQGQVTSPDTGVQQQPGDAFASMTPEQQAQQLADFNERAVDLLANQVYQVSEEEVTAFQEDPGKMLPQFAGRLHMQIMQAATMNVLRLMPQVLDNYNAQQKQGDSFKNAFYAANKDLNHEEHGQRVLQFGRMYRQANPQATNEQFINDVGAWVRTSLGLTQPATPPVQQQTQMAPVTPPYQPAGAGVMGAPVQGSSGNEFEELFNFEE